MAVGPGFLEHLQAGGHGGIVDGLDNLPERLKNENPRHF